MSEAMGRAEMPQAFRGEATGKILLADSVDAVSGKFFSPLIDEQPVPIQRFRGPAVSVDVAVQQMSGFGPKLDLSIPVSLAEQDQDPLLGLEVLDVQGGDFRGPCTGIVKQVQQGIVTEAVGLFEGYGFENLEHFSLVEEAGQGLPGTFLRDVEHGLSDLSFPINEIRGSRSTHHTIILAP